MATNYNGGVQLISEPTFFRELDVSAADFDGTDTANISNTLKVKDPNNSYFNPWKKNGGFLVKADTTGTMDVISWEDYQMNGKVIDDTMVQTIQVTAGFWTEERVVKVFNSSTVQSGQIGTVL